MDSKRLEEIETRLETATPGPWRVSGDFIVQTQHVTRDVWHIPRSYEDLHLMANAPDDLRDLLTEVRRLDTALYETNAQDELTIAGLRREVERMKPVFEIAMSMIGPSQGAEHSKCVLRSLMDACREAREDAR